MARTNAKEEELRKKEGIEIQRVKPPTPSLKIDALIGDEEQNRKQKKQGAGPHPSYPGPFGLIL